jgi:MOSC domain-containing protein YiiM
MSASESSQFIARVLGIAVRSGPGGPMQEIPSAHAAVDGGLEGDVASSPNRGITFLASGQWEEVCRELGAGIPWHTRRANVLVEAASLAHLIGRTISVGEIDVEVLAETRPCGLMDELHPGLRRALTPACRAGVHGRVIRAGRVCMGDPVRLWP